MTELLKNKPFRAMIPYYVLLDLDLNVQHVRLYGMIEQMESCEKTVPWFSYRFIADQLGIKNREGAIKVANKLRDKGYIGRKVNANGDHEWYIIRCKVVVSQQDTSSTSASIPAGQHPSIPAGYPKSLELKSHNLLKEKNNKKENNQLTNQEEKEVYKDQYYPERQDPEPQLPVKAQSKAVAKKKPKAKSRAFSVEDILNANIHGIPHDFILDWLEDRKKKRKAVTSTVWNGLNKKLSECVRLGFSAVDSFETMVTNGWTSLEAEWIGNLKGNQANKKVEYDHTSTEWAKDLGEF